MTPTMDDHPEDQVDAGQASNSLASAESSSTQSSSAQSSTAEKQSCSQSHEANATLGEASSKEEADAGQASNSPASAEAPTEKCSCGECHKHYTIEEYRATRDKIRKKLAALSPEERAERARLRFGYPPGYKYEGVSADKVPWDEL